MKWTHATVAAAKVQPGGSIRRVGNPHLVDVNRRDAVPWPLILHFPSTARRRRCLMERRKRPDVGVAMSDILN